MLNLIVYDDSALHQMGAAKLQIIQRILLLGIQFQRHLIYIECIVILILSQKAIPHIIHGVGFQLGVGRHIEHLLKSGIRIIVIAL